MLKLARELIFTICFPNQTNYLHYIERYIAYTCVYTKLRGSANGFISKIIAICW